MIELKALKKWTLIIVFCGAHSFFWGAMAGGSIVAMVAGFITVILGFSFIESHPAYQQRRNANALFGRAMDMGIRIRIYFTIYLAMWFALSTIGSFWRFNNPIFFVSALPYMAELWIGMGASWMCKFLTGFALEPGRSPVRDYNPAIQMGVEENFIATYVTTILTAAIHTILLAMLCGIIYFVLRLLKRHEYIS